MIKLVIFFGLLLNSFAKSDPCERKKRDASPDPDSNVIDFPDCTEFKGESNIVFCKSCPCQDSHHIHSQRKGGNKMKAIAIFFWIF